MVGTRPVKTRQDTTVGHLLREARERLGLSLPQVSEQLKIPVKHLHGLEEGDLSSFKAEVYARGAFRHYADFLGIRSETTQRAFLRVLSGAREYVPLKVHTPRSWLASVLTPRWILALVIAAIAVLVGTYIMSQVQSFLRLPNITITEPASNVVQGSSLTVKGQAEPDIRVRVNGTEVLLDKNSQFSVPLIVHPGINVLQIEAENAAGRKRVITRDLLMPRTGL
jgi:cytoskeleton protein RodZ